ncbi:MAG TPA: glycoside hydrolase family 27 protein [Steroidobacteraceae bacterium]|nr:glycoside hydrolase family 27 protein [Steroidobacteraceae bacterium]
MGSSYRHLLAASILAGGALACCLPRSAGAAVPAASTPPMGWNSYDAYGTTVSEAQFRANARWMSRHLARYGWRYAVIDAEWFVRNPTPSGGAAGELYVLDGYGRYVPAPNRFPSAAGGAGFKPLADYVHSLGLKFGIHILRGIPREAVARNLPIEGSPYTAAQAVDIRSRCPWNPDNYGVDVHRAAGQAYYDSIARLYASWGVDFIKADCIASHPYAGQEIRMLSAALAASGRDMMLSLSPGPAPIGKLAALRRHATMWRISNDVWDLWHSTVEYPQGVGDQFARAARWAPLAEPGHWPDADMLALGYLGPAPGWGEPREGRLTRAEQRTYLTLWCIARSPLFMGGNLTRMDRRTEGLLENPEVLAVDQHATHAHQALARDGFVVWLSQPAGGAGWYLAAFNVKSRVRTLAVSWRELKLPRTRYTVRDLWQHRDRGVASGLSVHLDAHGAALYRLLPR